MRCIPAGFLASNGPPRKPSALCPLKSGFSTNGRLGWPGKRPGTEECVVSCWIRSGVYLAATQMRAAICATRREAGSPRMVSRTRLRMMVGASVISGCELPLESVSAHLRRADTERHEDDERNPDLDPVAPAIGDRADGEVLDQHGAADHRAREERVRHVLPQDVRAAAPERDDERHVSAAVAQRETD